jgi:hypothetical protein
MLHAFRTAISFINSSNLCIASYKKFCIAQGVRPRKFSLDMDVRWNVTYMMLKHLIGHKAPFLVWVTANHPLVDGHPLLTENDWKAAKKLLLFLEQFYDSTVVLYPTSSLIMYHVLEIAGHLDTYKRDRDLRNVVALMKAKFEDYWSIIPMLYSFAFILDPRAKIRGFTNVLTLMVNLTGENFSEYLTTVRANLSNTFAKYDNKFGVVRLQRATVPGPAAGKRKTAWGKNFGGNAGGGIGAGASLASGLGGGTSLAAAGLSAGASLPTGLGGGACSSTRRSLASALLQAAHSGAT